MTMIATSQAHPLYAPNRACTACKLRDGCAGPVPGIGPISHGGINPQTGTDLITIMFIGEGPGKTEDEKGEPWTGQAG